MGLLRLMGNKADVVKGLAKRCNENWSVAPKSDIVSWTIGYVAISLTILITIAKGLYLSDIQVTPFLLVFLYMLSLVCFRTIL